MSYNIPEDIQKDLLKATSLHERTSSDYSKCVEFSALMSNILARLEDAGCDECDRVANTVMGILLDCNPKEGSHCDNSTRVRDRMVKISTLLLPPTS